jgi:hypothetical protein
MSNDLNFQSNSLSNDSGNIDIKEHDGKANPKPQEHRYFIFL